MPNLFRERQRAAAPVSPKQSVTWAVTWKSRFQVRGFGGMGIGIGFWVRKHQYLSLSHASSRLCAWSRSQNNHKTPLCSPTRILFFPYFHLALWLDTFFWLCTFPVATCTMSTRLHQTAATGDDITWLNFMKYAVYWYDEFCDSYGCEKLTTHCGMQRAALSSPNIQKPCSSPPETQTCFVRSAQLNC